MTSIFKVSIGIGKLLMNAKTVNKMLTLWLLTVCKLLTVFAKVTTAVTSIKNKMEVIINLRNSSFVLLNLRD